MFDNFKGKEHNPDPGFDEGIVPKFALYFGMNEKTGRFQPKLVVSRNEMTEMLSDREIMQSIAQDLVATGLEAQKMLDDAADKSGKAKGSPKR